MYIEKIKNIYYVVEKLSERIINRIKFINAVGLENVTNDAQLKIASNLSDVANRQTSLNNLTDVSGATNEHVLTKDTATGNVIFKASAGGGGTASFGITIDGGGAAIGTGFKGYILIPFACTVTKWEIFADQTGSIVIDIWKGTYGTLPSSSGDSIADSEKPTVSSAVKGQDTSLTTWTTAINANDVIAFNVDSCSTIERINLIITVTK
jgi:hypothetical protein